MWHKQLPMFSKRLNKMVKVKVKQSHYSNGQTLRVPGGWGSQISRQSAHEGGKVVSPKHRPPLPPGTFLVHISVRGWVNLRAILRPEGLCQWKNPITPSVIETATFWLVTQCLNQLRHRVPQIVVVVVVVVVLLGEKEVHMEQWKCVFLSNNIFENNL